MGNFIYIYITFIFFFFFFLNLQELVKYDTKAEHPNLEDLKAGLESIKRVTELTNELKRQVENEKITEDLKNNIQDWKVRLIN